MKKRLFAIILTLVMVLSLVPAQVFATDGSADAHDHETTEVVREAETATKAAGDADVLAFTSDTHNKTNNTAAKRLGTWLDKMNDSEHYGDLGGVDVMAFGGDMGDAGDGTNYWTNTQADMKQLTDRGITGVYTTGNHEYSPGSYSSSSTNATQKEFVIDKEAEVGDTYRIFCLGSRSTSSSYANQVSTLTSYLNSVGNDKVIFIITHFPLHYYSGRTTSSASSVIDALNNAVDNNGQTIVFLWGHNHTMADTYYDQIYGPGGVDSIQYDGSGNTKTIKFYYGAAGCMSDSEYSASGSAKVLGKGLVVAISKNRGNATMTFGYYNADGLSVTESNSVKSADVTVRATSTYTLTDTLEEGKEYIIANGNTGEVYVVGNESTGSGTSTGLKGIAATVQDGKITLSEDDASKAAFTAEIKTSNSGSVSAWLNQGGKYLYTASSGGLRISNEQTSSSNTGKFWHYKADDKNLLWFFKDESNNDGYTDTSQTYRYYLKSESGVFTSDHVGSGQSLSSTTTPAIYLFVKGGSGGTTPEDPQTGETVNITPTSSNSPEVSATIAVGETLTINVTNGSSSSAYDFTASLSKSGIAKINGNATVNIAAGSTGTFTVEGLADGTVDINISSNGSYSTRKGTIHLTVGDGGTTPVDPPAGNSVDITPTTSNPEVSATIAVDETLTINVENSSTNSGYNYTATLSNSGIAEIQGDSTINIAKSSTGQFTVKGLANGTVDINIVNDQSSSSYQRKGVVHLTVGEGGDDPTPGEDATYYLTESLVDGGEYLVVNGKTGSVFAIGNESTGSGTSTGLKGVSATVVSDSITLSASDAAKATFTVEIKTSQSGAVSAWLKQDDKYLYTASSGGLRISNEQTTNSGTTDNTGKFWHYKADDKNLLWYFKDTSSSDGYTNTSSTYRYYLKYSSSGVFTSANVGSNTSLSNTDTPAIYLFKKGTGETISVTEVTLDKSALSLEVGQTGTLTATVSPENATNKNVTWSTSDSSIATVSNGTVTAVAAGTATITVTTVDGEKTATCAVTVSAAGPVANVDYVLADTLVNGKDYLVANGDTGSVYLVSNEANGSKTLKGIAASVVDGTITITETNAAKAAFTFESKTSDSGAISGWLKNGEKYLYTDSSNGLRMDTAQTSSGNTGKFWHYKGGEKNLLWYFKDTSSSDGYTDTSGNYRYYLEYDASGNFTDNHVQNESLEATTTPAIYLFVKADQAVAATDVTLDKTTADLLTGNTVTLNATVTPAGTTYQALTWTSSDETVATVEDGVVTAVGAGTATITVTTASGKTATCTVTVTAPKVDRYVKVDSIKAGGEYIITNDADVGATTTRALKNPGGSSSGVTISSSNGKTTVTILEGNIIETSDTDIVWTATANGSTGGFYLTNGDDYLEVYQQSLRVFSGEPKQAARYWTYNLAADANPNQLRHNGGNSTYSLYYTNGSFSASSSTTNAVYIFEKVSDTPHEHTYGQPEWSWANGYTSATATFTCTAGDDTKSVTDNAPATVIVTAAGCETNKVVKYTAKVTFNGTEYTTETANITVENSALGHEWGEWSVTTPATCTTAGVETRECGRCHDTETRSIEALGHAYGEPAWTWVGNDANGYTSATATFTCGNNSDHTETVTDSQIEVVTVEATATQNGSKTYKASVEFGGKTYTDQKVVVIPATGYTFKDPVYTWTEKASGWSVTALKECNEDPTQSITETVDAVLVVVTAATCTEAGTGEWTATFTNTAFTTQTRDAVIQATGHDWEYVDFSWTKTANGYTAVANYKCKHNDAHTNTVTATVTSQTTTAATCTEEGQIVYTASITATASLDGAAHSTTKTDVIEALGHDWEFVDFSWTGSDAAGYTAAVANYRCKNNTAHTTTANATVTSATTAATCEAAGQTVYTASVTATASLDGAAHSATKTVAIAALGHDWNDPTWVWTGYTQAVATFTCKNDNNNSHPHTETATGSAITSEVTTPAGPGTTGVRTYTATVTFNNKTYTNQKTETIPATGSSITVNVTSSKSDTDDMTIKITKVGATAATATQVVHGNLPANATYTFSNIQAGEYTVSISKRNHVTREYTVTVGASEVVVDAKIHLLGDVNGDGEITTVDAAMANAHAREYKEITDEYILKVADVNGIDDVTTGDAALINMHVREVEFLWTYDEP